ncbi:MAG: DUF3516 domain-containing protein, partial [Acidobacteriota bacterium]
IRRFISFGIGIHHAGLLPKYRLLVEQLAQQGLLKVICGTDTLGVGVNVPIRTVLFTKLAKYDGEKVSILRVRDFQQIAGRAGRKGYDDRGSVVCQAPEHIIESRKAAMKAQGNPKKMKKLQAKKPPKGFVSWNDKTFRSLIDRPPETLKSRFRITHGMLINLLQRDAEVNAPERDNFDSLRELIERSHEDDKRKKRHLAFAAMLVRSLGRAGIIKALKDTQSSYYWIVVDEELQWDFNLFQALALYLVEAIEVLDPEDLEYALDAVTVTESILENPNVVLFRQRDKMRTEAIGRMKAEGIRYDERMAKLEEIDHPKPILEFIEATFESFRQAHPWVRGEDIRPKSIGRDMYEGYYTFNRYVRYYGMQRSEGVLLRYLSQLYKTLVQTVPERAKTEAFYDVLGFFRTMLEHVDSSLIEEWESMLHPELQMDKDAQREARRELRAYELFHDPKAFVARVRAELHLLVSELAEGDFEAAVSAVWPGPEDSEYRWDEGRFQESLEPFLASYGQLVFNHGARASQHTRVRQTSPRTWDFSQVLVDPEGDNQWYLAGEIDLQDPKALEGKLLRLRHLGT